MPSRGSPLWRWSLGQLARRTLTRPRPPRLRVELLGDRALPSATLFEWPATDAVDRRELAIIDRTVPDAQQLAQTLLTRDTPTAVAFLDPGEEGLTTLTGVIRTLHHLDAIHLVSHAAPGTLLLGETRLTTETVTTFAPFLREWGAALKPGGDLLLYGCDLAGTEAGQTLVRHLGDLTGADVAASTDPTGDSARGGNWTLEFVTGPIEAEIALGPVEWPHLLAAPGPGLLVSTVSDVGSSGAPGLASWAKEEVLHFGGPSLALGTGGTSGTFSSLLNLGPFGDGDVNLDAVHFVARTVTVGRGAATMTLLPGDVLFSTASDETLTSLNSLSFTKDEVVLFRPTVPGDYTAGTFALLLDDFKAVHGGDETWGLALVETNTPVGDVTLSAGTFLFSRKGRSEHSDVRLFVPTGVGPGRTAGSVAVLLEGDDLNYSTKIYGLDLVQETTVLGGVALPAGTILISLEGDTNSVGTNAISVRRQDVVALAVERTTLGTGTSVATASVLFRGVDVGLESSSETLDALSLILADFTPSASADTYTTAEDTPLTVGPAGVLTNDTDPNGDPLTAVLVAGPSHGTLTLNADGSFNYTPNADYSGTDSFTYQARDPSGALSAVTTVSLTVTPVNDAPVAVADHYTLGGLLPSLSVTAPGVLANDTDADGDSLTAQLVSGPSNGSLSFNADGSFTYTPNLLFLAGTDSFTYRVRDGLTLSAPVTVTIQVGVLGGNLAPTATADAYSTSEDTPLTVAGPGVLANDSDPNGDTLAAVLVSGPSRGTLTLNADGSFVYTPNANYSGPDSFTYRVTDGSLSSGSVTVSLTVTAVNDPPTLDPIGDVYLSEDAGPQSITLTGITAGGGESQTLTITASSSNPGLIPPPTVSYTSPAATGTLSFTPVANGHGTAVITVTVSDGSRSFSRTFLVAVAPVNDPPIATDDSALTAEDGSVSGDVLPNDSDPDGDPLGAVLLSGPTNGTVILNPDGTFTYTPFANFAGADSFTYQVSDGVAVATGTVFLTVTPVNDAPTVTVTPLPLGYTENAGPTAVDPALTLTDIDSATLSGATVTLIGFVPGEDVLAFLPLGNITGSFDATTGVLTLSGIDTLANYQTALRSITYENTSENPSTTLRQVRFAVTDDLGLSSSLATRGLGVTPVNDAPVAAADAYLGVRNTPLVVTGPGVLANDTDAEGDTLTALLVQLPTNGTVVLNLDGSFTYTPNSGFWGTDSFAYQVTDGQATSGITLVTLTVVPQDTPETTPDDYTVNEDGPLTVAGPGVLANDLDPNGEPFSAVLVSGPSHGTLILNPDGSFTYTPDPDFHGTDQFNYKASDGDAESGATQVRITVNGVSDAPRGVSDQYSTEEDTPLVVSPGVLANDSDPDGDPLRAELTANPVHGTLTLALDGTFIYTPDPGFSGTDTFSYRPTDGSLTGSVVTVTITVRPVNDPPVAVGETYTLVGGETLLVSGPGVLGNDFDPEGDPLSALLVSGPLHGTLTLTADGSFAYTPDPGYSGTDRFTYHATDGALSSSVVTVTITVSPSVSPWPTEPPVEPPADPASPSPAPIPLSPTLGTGAGSPSPGPGADPASPVSPGSGPDEAQPTPAGDPVNSSTDSPQPPGDAKDSSPQAVDLSAGGAVLVGAGPLPVAESVPMAVFSVTAGGGTDELNHSTSRHEGESFISTTSAPTRLSAGGHYAALVPTPGPAEVPAPVPEPAPSQPPPPPPELVPPDAPPPVAASDPPTPPPAPPLPPAPEVAPPSAPPLAEPAPAEVPLDSILPALEEIADKAHEASPANAVTDLAVTTGAVIAAGYVLFSPRTAYWLLTALLARPVLWRNFDPLTVIYAWEKDPKKRTDRDDESLQSMVEK